MHSINLLNSWRRIAAALVVIVFCLGSSQWVYAAEGLNRKLGDLDGDGKLTILDMVPLLDHLSGRKLLPVELTRIADIDRSGSVDRNDEELLGDAIVGAVPPPGFPVTRLVEASPAHGEEMVSPARTVILRFDGRVVPSTVTTNSFYLIANSERLPGTITVSSTEMFATILPSAPLPASSLVRIVVDGNLIRDRDGRLLDADGDFIPGGRAQYDFQTLSLSRIPGTAVSGYVYDSYRTNADGSNVPIIGATIRVDAFPEANAVTDSLGFFTLTNVPAPEFFVHIDGSTAVNPPRGSTYPSGGKLFHSVPGRSTVMPPAFNVYLPPMALGDIAALPTDRPVDVGFGPAGLAELARMFPTNDQSAFRRVCVTVTPGSAVDDAGRPATQAIIIPVPPYRLPSPLPSNLTPKLVISVQAMLPDGASATRFDVPVPLTFPNLDGLAPGEKALFFSYNHAAGRWDVIGAGTATTNGTIQSDPGVGIRAPGWHLVQVGTGAAANSACQPGEVCARFEGELGDLIKINLGGTVALSDIHPPDPRINFVIVSTISGGVLFDEDGEPIFGTTAKFRASGVAYFRPWIFEPSKSSERVNGKLKYPAKGATGPLTGSFQASLWSGNQEKRDNDTIGVIRIDVGEEYSTQGENAVKPGSSKLNVMSQRQRLRYLGFPDRSGQVVEVIADVQDAGGQWALGLFNEALINGDSWCPMPNVTVASLEFLNARKAPRWKTISIPGWSSYSTPNGGHAGTDWAEDLMKSAHSFHAFAAQQWLGDVSPPNGQGSEICDQSCGGQRCGHHGSGTRFDVGFNGWGGDFDGKKFFDYTAQGWVKANILNTTGQIVDTGLLILKDGTTDEFEAIALGETPPSNWSRVHYTRLVEPVNLNTEAGKLTPKYLTAAYKTGLLATRADYDRSEIAQQLIAWFKATSHSGAKVKNILWNDPFFYLDPPDPQFATELAANGLSPAQVDIKFYFNHNAHYHINVKAPTAPQAAVPSPFRAAATPISISTALGFGSDTRLYYRFQIANGFELAGRSSLAGTFTEILSPNTDYTLTLYRPADNRWAVYRGRSNASGAVTDLGTIILDQFGGPDSDGDGIPDQGEYAMGTLPDSADSDGDGITDDAELTQGLNPNNRVAFPTGVIASLPLRGEAKEVVVEENLAYVATGSYGLAIVDVSRFDQPIVNGQLDLPGDATDVGMDPGSRLAAVAAGASGIQIVDVSDPALPRLVQMIDLPCKRLEVFGTTIYAAVQSSLLRIDLRTGKTLDSLTITNGIPTDLAKEGSFVYLMDAGKTLRVVDASGYEMEPRGSLTLTEGAGRLFVGNGVAYAAAATKERGGYSTVNVSDPSNLTLISDSDSGVPFFRPATAIVANGSGLGLLIGNPLGNPSVNVMDTSDLSKTDQPLTTFQLPAPPSAAAIGSGIGFIACGAAGLQVVNYLPFDNARRAPSIAIGGGVQDVDPSTPGVQVFEGSTLTLRPSVSDDRQVRDVTLFVNGAPVRTDVAFPWDFGVVVPALRGGSSTLTVQFRANDTGGNATMSAPVTYGVLPDTISPTPLFVFPRDNFIGFEGITLARIYYSEPLNAASIAPGNVQLVEAGSNGLFGDGDDVIVPTSAELGANALDILLRVAPLSPGLYELRVASERIQDRVGNRQGTGTWVSHFRMDPLSKAPKVAAGDGHSVVIHTDGSLWAWGRNDVGQLGDGTRTQRLIPVQIGSDTNWATVAAGSLHTVAVKASGSLWAWGSGTVVDGTGIDKPSPIRIGADNDWLMAAAYFNHTLAIKQDGSLWAWGSNSRGQLGLGTVGGGTGEPTRVGSDFDWTSVAAGGLHTVALKRDGSLWAWGYNNSGELGDGTRVDRALPVSLNAGTGFVSVGGGGSHSLAVHQDGSLWLWGANNWNCPGGTTAVGAVLRPTSVHTDNYAHVVGGGGYSLALKRDKTLWAWGNNSYGTLGDGSIFNASCPLQILTNQTLEGCAAGVSHSVAVTTEGKVFTWGRNEFGQLGDGSLSGQTTPLRIGTDTDWRSAFAGGGYAGSYSVAVKTDGSLWVWGYGSREAFQGFGTTDPPHYPAIPTRFGTNNDWQSAVAGAYHFAGIKTNGSLWMWGWGPNGQLGDGGYQTRSSPVPVVGNSVWRTVTLGAKHTMGIRSDGTLWAWGDNRWLQLATEPSHNSEPTPTQVTAYEVALLATGPYYTMWWSPIDSIVEYQGQSDASSTCNCYFDGGPTWRSLSGSAAVDGSGRLWQTDALSTTQVGTDTDWLFVSDVGNLFASGFGHHYAALKVDRTLWTWGDNDLGQVGDGTRIKRTSPTKIDNGTRWRAVSAGFSHTVGVKQDGSLWAWGSNKGGELGENSSFLPRQIGNGSMLGPNLQRLVSRRAVWKYLDDGSNQESAWRARGFNDTSWPTGGAPFGYGNTDSSTEVRYGTDPTNKYITTYFRRSFSVPNAFAFTNILLRLLRDDGAVVYLNGTEVFRSNMPAGTISYDSSALTPLSGTEELSLAEVHLNPGALLTGTNVLAVEIHQANRTSSDIRFDLELLASP